MCPFYARSQCTLAASAVLPPRSAPALLGIDSRGRARCPHATHVPAGARQSLQTARGRSGRAPLKHPAHSRWTWTSTRTTSRRGPLPRPLSAPLNPRRTLGAAACRPSALPSARAFVRRPPSRCPRWREAGTCEDQPCYLCGAASRARPLARGTALVVVTGFYGDSQGCRHVVKNTTP